MPIDNIMIRQYQPSDKKAIRDLNQESVEEFANSFIRPDFPDLDEVEKIYLVNNGEFLVATKDSRVIGMGALKKISNEMAEVKRMRVFPEFQRQGIGQLILNELEKRAKQLGYKILELDTSINQPGAQDFYRKNGYHETKREGPEKGWPVETIFYQKHL
jgi:ribosomal protein S18 acetylase RimI-like enzyme